MEAWRGLRQYQIVIVALVGFIGLSAWSSDLNYPVLEWFPIPGAVKYQIEISTSQDFVSTVLQEIVVTPHYQWLRYRPGNYYWRVVAIGEDGNTSEPSKAAVLKVKVSRPSNSRAIAPPAPEPPKAAEPLAKSSEKLPDQIATDRPLRSWAATFGLGVVTSRRSERINQITSETSGIRGFPAVWAEMDIFSEGVGEDGASPRAQPPFWDAGLHLFFSPSSGVPGVQLNWEGAGSLSLERRGLWSLGGVASASNLGPWITIEVEKLMQGSVDASQRTSEKIDTRTVLGLWIGAGAKLRALVVAHPMTFSVSVAYAPYCRSLVEGRSPDFAPSNGLRGRLTLDWYFLQPVFGRIQFEAVGFSGAGADRSSGQSEAIALGATF